MKIKVATICIGIVLVGFLLIYNSNEFKESMINKPRCPNILIQKGNEIWLYNNKLANIPGVNPIIFHTLDEYTEFLNWQKSQGINCPVLALQQGYSTQGEPYYQINPADSVPVTLLQDATRNDPPYNTNSYPGFDAHNQTIGLTTPLDKYQDIGQTQAKSANALDPNWDSVYGEEAVKAGNYKGNEVFKYSSV